MRLVMILAAALLVASPAAAVQPRHSILADPPRDSKYPAHNQQLLIPSHGAGMNALLFVAAGKDPHPTVILMHGLPGNERNLDLAQAMRRAGWDVLTFTYRGAWGSPGDFSIANAMADTQAALDFARSPEGAKLGIDPGHIVLAGHSMGGATAMMTAAHNRGLSGLILIDAWDISADARNTAKATLVRGMDDFGNALHGTSPDNVAAEVVTAGANWDMATAAPRIGSIPVLTVTATYGGATDNRRLTAALRRSPARVTAVELASDHSFADHRIVLAQTVVRWLNRLR